MAKRPPIVVVMGHVDHGKTTLLDYIRKTNTAAREAGGITQSIGAYEIEHSSISSGQAQKITFIDTPGHEAFMTMRQRGATAADLGILVVAADDGVQNQTKEAFKILQESKTPFIVAINKIDKNNADINKTKNDLAQVGILLEGFGGNISWHGVSAKTGEGINELLDLVILATDLENLTYEPTAPAKGFILESHLDKNRGVVATAIIKDGTLTIGSQIFSPSSAGKIKLLENFLEKRISEALPSMPVLILGFVELPKIGEEFSADKSIFETANAHRIKTNVRTADVQKLNSENVIKVILKADTSGSLEALASIIKALPIEKMSLAVIDESVGEITDGDVKEASAYQAVIIGFGVKATKAADNLAEGQHVRIIISKIIYELIKTVEEILKNKSGAIISGDLQILAIFGKKGNRQIIGGKALAGEIYNNTSVEVQRNEQIVGNGRVVNLQQAKQDVKKVTAGNECGLLFESDIEIRVGDHIISRL